MKKWTILIIIILVFVLGGVQVFSVNCIPILKNIANKELERFCQLIVNQTTFNYNDISADLINIERDNENNIKMIDFNMAYATKIAGEIVLQIEETLLSIEEGEYASKKDTIYDKKIRKISDDGGVIASVPMGMLTNNPFFASLGPKMKIRYQTLSHVSSTIKKDVKNYGINHMMVGLTVVVTIKVMVLVPFYKEEHVQNISFPLTLEIIEGEVPNWYQN